MHDDSRAFLIAQGFDLSVLDTDARASSTPEVEKAAAVTEGPKLSSYDRFVVAFSGGKDSLALVLHLLEQGVPADKIELHHHLVDGNEGSTLMDWPITRGYCEAIAKALSIPLSLSWRKGGFEAEMLRNQQATAPAMVPDANGLHVPVGGNGPLGLRRKFPQVSADLSVRWCSSSMKISIMDAYLRHHPKFLNSRTLILTGERAQESKARANYKPFEPHRADTRDSQRVPRHIDVWRAVHAWREEQVWAVIGRWKLVAHPAYYLGWGRCSCRCCIFGSSDQWASARKLAPAQFSVIAGYEKEFGVTIHRKLTVQQRAEAGAPYLMEPYWMEIANAQEFNRSVYMDPWDLPAGAYGESCGPT
jgi:3'-phosphoadenosine 5'-phosphosulfate sulfotransferase (PAPS reductase)/FAD synthetase